MLSTDNGGLFQQYPGIVDIEWMKFEPNSLLRFGLLWKRRRQQTLFEVSFDLVGVDALRYGKVAFK